LTIPTEQNPWWSWPTRADVTRGVDRYVRFLQHQGDVNRKIAISWVAAVTPTPRAVHSGARGPEQPTAGAGDTVVLAAGEAITSDPVEHEPTKPLAEQNLERNDLFDNLIDNLIDADILDTSR
jgi:hypothetical protein